MALIQFFNGFDGSIDIDSEYRSPFLLSSGFPVHVVPISSFSRRRLAFTNYLSTRFLHCGQVRASEFARRRANRGGCRGAAGCAETVAARAAPPHCTRSHWTDTHQGQHTQSSPSKSTSLSHMNAHTDSDTYTSLSEQCC